MHAIAIQSMNIQHNIHLTKPSAQVNNLYSNSSREITPTGALASKDIKILCQDKGGDAISAVAERGTDEKSKDSSSYRMNRRSGSVFMNNASSSKVDETPEKENHDDIGCGTSSFMKRMEF